MKTTQAWRDDLRAKNLRQEPSLGEVVLLLDDLDEALALAKENGASATRAHRDALTAITERDALRAEVVEVKERAERAERAEADRVEERNEARSNERALRAELAAELRARLEVVRICEETEAAYRAELERKDAALRAMERKLDRCTDECSAAKDVRFMIIAALAPAEQREKACHIKFGPARDGERCALGTLGCIVSHATPGAPPSPGTCICANIIATDERRHFRECPLRAKYPDPPPGTPPGPPQPDYTPGWIDGVGPGRVGGVNPRTGKKDAPSTSPATQAEDECERVAREFFDERWKDRLVYTPCVQDLAALLRAQRDEAHREGWNEAVDACAQAAYKRCEWSTIDAIRALRRPAPSGGGK